MNSESPVRHPNLGDLASGEGALKAFGFEGQWGLSAGAPQNWGKERLHSWRLHTRFRVNGDPEQSSDSIGAWEDLPVGRPFKEGSFRRQGGWRWLTVGARTLVVEIPENIHWHELSWKWLFWLPFWHQDLPHPTACRFQGQDVSGQTINRVGKQPRLLADSLSKAILSQQLPISTPLDMFCPPERQDPALLTRVQALVPPTRKPEQAPGVASSMRGQDTRMKRNYSPAA